MQSVARYPSPAASIAMAIPVFPDVASRSTRSRVRPAFSAARIIPSAARSFTLPPGLRHSALARSRTFGATWEAIRSKGTSGVRPIRSATRVSTGPRESAGLRLGASALGDILVPKGPPEHVEGEQGALPPDDAQRNPELD